MKRFAGVVLLVASIAVSGLAQNKQRCNPQTDLGMAVNGVAYKCTTGRGWVLDEDAMKAMAKEQEHERRLRFALVSRVLTNAEMGEVESLGFHLFTQPMTPYQEAEVMREFNDALLQQFRLRIAAGKSLDCEALKTHTAEGPK